MAARNFQETSRHPIGSHLPFGGQWVGDRFRQRTTGPDAFRFWGDPSCAGRCRLAHLDGLVRWRVISGERHDHRRGSGRRVGQRPRIVAVHCAPGWWRRVQRCRSCRPLDCVLVLGAYLKCLQRRSSFGRSSSTTVGRPGRLRRCRVDGRRCFVPGIRRQVLVVVPADQRRPRYRLRSLRCRGPASPRGGRLER